VLRVNGVEYWGQALCRVFSRQDRTQIVGLPGVWTFSMELGWDDAAIRQGQGEASIPHEEVEANGGCQLHRAMNGEDIDAHATSGCCHTLCMHNLASAGDQGRLVL
jgi:hypothetical protein